MAEVLGCEIPLPRSGYKKTGFPTGCTLSCSFMDGSPSTRPVAMSWGGPVESFPAFRLELKHWLFLGQPASFTWWSPKDYNQTTMGECLEALRVDCSEVSSKREPIQSVCVCVCVCVERFIEWISSCDYGSWEVPKFAISKLETQRNGSCTSNPENQENKWC